MDQFHFREFNFRMWSTQITGQLQYFRRVQEVEPAFPLKKEKKKSGCISPFKETTTLLSILDDPNYYYVAFHVPSMLPALHLFFLIFCTTLKGQLFLSL